jgi:hypothetical protein
VARNMAMTVLPGFKMDSRLRDCVKTCALMSSR